MEDQSQTTMDKSWDFILKNGGDDEKKLLVEVARENNIIPKNKGYKQLLEWLYDAIGQDSFQTFVFKIADLNEIPLDYWQNDMKLLMAAIVKKVLIANKDMRQRFIKKEHFASTDTETFMKEFDYRLDTSGRLTHNIPIYGLSIALGGKESEFLTNSNFGLSSLATMGAVAGTMLGIPLGILGSLVTSKALFGISPGFTDDEEATPLITRIFSSITSEKTRNYNAKITALALALMYIYISKNIKINSLEEAKRYIVDIIRYNEHKANINILGVNKPWSDCRLALLKHLMEVHSNNKSVRNCLSNSAISCNKPIRQYFPAYKLNQLSPYSNQLIEFIYSMDDEDYSMDVKDAPSSHYVHGHAFSKPKLYVTYCIHKFKYVNLQQYFFVPLRDKFAKALITLYLAYLGVEYPETHIVTSTIDAKNRDVVKLKSNKLTKDFGKEWDALMEKEMVGVEDRQLPNIMLSMSPNNRVREIEVLKKTIAENEERVKHLEQELEDKKLLCRRFHHDVGNMFGMMGKIRMWQKFPDLINKDEVDSVVKVYKDIAVVWDMILDQHNEPEILSHDEVMDIFRSKIPKEFNLEIEGECPVYVISQKAELTNIVYNLVANLKDHAFPEEDFVFTPRVRVHSETAPDGQLLKIHVLNNGMPIEGDLSEIFKYKIDTKKGLGLYSMRRTMRTYEGDLNISRPNTEDFSTDYIFTFKTTTENDTVILA